MHKKLAAILVLTLSVPRLARAENIVSMVKKAAEKSTLNQPGTRPFHLKATLAPSKERDADSHRTGEIEIWWASPTQWKREVRSPEFHQIEIVNGTQDWQKNEGGYFPEWLRETAVALIEPMPHMDQVLDQVKDADVKRLMGSTYFSWIIQNVIGNVRGGIGASVAITDSTGLLFYDGGVGWGGMFQDYQDFHGRKIARSVSAGSPEVTAKVLTLEDLQAGPAFFAPPAEKSDAPLLRTLVISQASLGNAIAGVEERAWPTLQDGPLEGSATTDALIDRNGRIREIGTVVCNNPGITDAARDRILSMQFKPYVDNGDPVQAVVLLTIPFKTTRPVGSESFDTAQHYFELGRRVSFPATGSAPYSLTAKFQARTSSGNAEEGEYSDTFLGADQWSRTASIGKSRYVRSQHGDKCYQLPEGPDTALLRLVLRVMEPIPAIDTFVESDWRIKRDTVNDVKTIRVLTGYESPEGKFDPEHARVYWFDESGKLLKTFFLGLETDRSQFETFSGVEVPRQIRVLRDGKLAMIITVTQISPPANVDPSTFALPKHEWTRAFTDEVR
jgi:hypothetical protein